MLFGENTPVSKKIATILIVDDQPDNRYLYKYLLGKAGHIVLEAETGAAALSILQVEHPDLLITDLMMPGQMNGGALVKAVRADPEIANTEIIFSTAYPRDKAEELARALQIGYVISSSVPEIILETVEDALAGKTGPLVPDPPSLDERIDQLIADLETHAPRN